MTSDPGAPTAIATAPEGGGPFNPAIPATISLRYGGCSSTGIDDGHTVRTLTRASVQPFVQGPNQVTIQSWALESVLK